MAAAADRHARRMSESAVVQQSGRVLPAVAGGDRWGVPVYLGERGVLRPGRWRWLRALLWAAVATGVLSAVYGVLPALVDDLLPRDSAPLQALGVLATVAVAVVLYVLGVRVGEGRWPRELDLGAAPRGLATGLGLGVLLMGAVMAVLVGTRLYEVEVTGLASAWRPASVAVAAGVVEELLLRGVLLRLLWRAAGPWVAFAVSAAVFGAAHLANPHASVVAAVAIALEAGVMLGAFYALTGRLWVSIGLHAAWNLTQGYVFGAAVSGIDTGPSLAVSTPSATASTWLTGGGFGPEASLPALVLCAALGLTALLLARRAGRFARG